MVRTCSSEMLISRKTLEIKLRTITKKTILRLTVFTETTRQRGTIKSNFKIKVVENMKEIISFFLIYSSFLRNLGFNFN